MAYALKGSRPIAVDGLNYRWRRSPEGDVMVWHVLDAGRLVVHVPGEVGWVFDPMPGFVAACIREARRQGWNTHEHHTLALDVATFGAMVGYGADTRMVDGIEGQLELLGAPPTPDSGLFVRLLLLPRLRPSVLISADRDTLLVAGVHRRSLEQHTAATDPTWLEDIIVQIREVQDEPTSGFQAQLLLVDPLGRRSWQGEPTQGPLKAAADGLWRAAHALCPQGRHLLEPLHGPLTLAEPPWEVLPDRVLRLFGTLTPARVHELLDQTASGGWLIDASAVELPEPSTPLLLQASNLGEVWVAREAPLPGRPWRRSLAEARRARMERIRLAFAHRFVPRIDPRWAAQAGERLARGGALDRLDAWLTEAWSPCETPVDAVFLTEQVCFEPPDEAHWIAMNREGLYVRTANGMWGLPLQRHRTPSRP